MQTILITGASKGIGKEVAKLFSKQNYNLILVSRNQNELENLKQEIINDNDIYCVEIDLSKEDGPKKLYDYCKDNDLKIDVLINNAGFGDFKEFIEGDLNKYKMMIDLNIKALMELSYLFINDMKDSGGQIINIASIASFMPGPYMAVYYASKAFVLNFSLALNEELKPYHIAVSAICPGPVNTDFWPSAGGSIKGFKEKYLATNADKIAEKVLKIYKTKKAFIVVGFSNKLLAFLTRLMSKSLLAKITGKTQRKLVN